MVTRASVGAALCVALALVACTSDDASPGPSTTDAESRDVASTEVSVTSSAPPSASTDEDVDAVSETSVAPATLATTTAPASTTTQPTRSDVVPRDGSVEDVLGELTRASRFAGGVAAWLDAVPGQEGVLRNVRGVTLFVPADDGFSEADRAAAFVDPDASAMTLSEHLRVGDLDLDDLPDVVVTSSGREHVVTPGPRIGGRLVIATEVASNGVVVLIDGPLDAEVRDG